MKSTKNWHEYFRSFTCVKSLITLALTGAFIYLCVMGAIDTNNFMNVFYIVISFYFGSQWEKKNSREEKKNDSE